MTPYQGTAIFHSSKELSCLIFISSLSAATDLLPRLLCHLRKYRVQSAKGDTLLGSKIPNDEENQTCKKCVSDQTWAKHGLSELGFWRPVPRVELEVCSSTFCVVCSLEYLKYIEMGHFFLDIQYNS